MSPSIFLTLLCLGVASAAPAAPVADLSAEAQAEQWAAAVIWDTVGNVGNCAQGLQRRVRAVGVTADSSLLRLVVT